MARIRLIVLAVLAVFCVGVVAAATASASEGELVNAKGEALIKNKIVGTSGTTRLETLAGTSIICTSNIARGIITSKTGGELTVLFKGCTSGALSCRGGKDSEGEAPAGSIYVLVGLLIKRSNATERLILLTVHKPGTLEAGEIEIICSGVKIKVKGSFLTTNNIVIKKPATKYEFTATQEKGKQTVTEYENEKGAKVKCSGLEASIEGLAFEGAGQGGGSKKTEVAKEDALFEEEVEFL